jgi:RNA polymerase sigma-B factor
MDPETTDRFRAYRASQSRDLRNALVEEHLRIADFVARRYANRGEPFDDLRQVALIGLLKAVERFDPDHGVAFVSFAVPTITGEIKRHFRDRTWSIRVPRALQERTRAIETAREELGQALGRSPTVAELSAHLDATDEEILEGLEAATMYSSGSLDEPVTGTVGGSLGDVLPSRQDDYALAEDRSVVEQLLAHLAPREHRIVYLRYFEGLTQSEIGNRLGISQMHVSRLLTRSLDALAQAAGAADPTGVAPVEAADCS